MTALVILSSALICFQGHCYNALVGNRTPIGVFAVTHMLTEQKGYGGDVLVFDETDSTAFAIHRIWLQNPKEHRMERLNSNDSNKRQITHGCINVSSQVYDLLVKDLKTLEIREY